MKNELCPLVPGSAGYLILGMDSRGAAASKKAESTSAHGYRVTRVIFVKSSDGYFALMK